MSESANDQASIDYHRLAQQIKKWGQDLGFNAVGIADVDLKDHEQYLQQWLDNGYHGDMTYMSRHGMLRARPQELHQGSIRVISARMDYLPEQPEFIAALEDPNKAYVSRYALGRDYHKVLRQRLKQLGEKIKVHCEHLNYRPFVDSAPILERPLAAKAGLGWIGKHSLLLNQSGGSWFFLGELLVNIPLPVDQAIAEQCGSCTACMKICPTQAIVAPYVVDSRRCISYLTIELQGSIPEALRPLIGNRIYGCDDCQLVCPWTQFAKTSLEVDFQPRNDLDSSTLLDLFSWDETTFTRRLAGSAIYRIGFQQWQRNIAVALGNAPYSEQIIAALDDARASSSDLVLEHIDWALAEQKRKHTDAQNAPLPGLTQKLIRTIDKLCNAADNSCSDIKQ